MLLQEINHRVKNNMQVITSMLSLQAREETDSHTVDVLNESQRRIKIMARVHEALSRSNDLASINSKDYLDELVNDIIESIGNNEFKHINLNFDVDDITFSVKDATTYGQIISELLSNCLKHAFPNGQYGKINITLHKWKGGEIELLISDDGKGLPEDFDIQKIQTLGMGMVNALVTSLRGMINVDGSDGTSIQITIPEYSS